MSNLNKHYCALTIAFSLTGCSLPEEQGHADSLANQQAIPEVLKQSEDASSENQDTSIQGDHTGLESEKNSNPTQDPAQKIQEELSSWEDSTANIEIATQFNSNSIHDSIIFSGEVDPASLENGINQADLESMLTMAVEDLQLNGFVMSQKGTLKSITEEDAKNFIKEVVYSREPEYLQRITSEQVTVIRSSDGKKSITVGTTVKALPYGDFEENTKVSVNNSKHTDQSTTQPTGIIQKPTEILHAN